MTDEYYEDDELRLQVVREKVGSELRNLCHRQYVGSRLSTDLTASLCSCCCCCRSELLKVQMKIQAASR